MGSEPQQARLSLMSECADMLLTPCVAAAHPWNPQWAPRLLLMGQEGYRKCWWFIKDDMEKENRDIFFQPTWG